jgi:hypothetical protein
LLAKKVAGEVDGLIKEMFLLRKQRRDQMHWLRRRLTRY